MSRDPGCIFCKILAGEIPAAIVYQDQAVVAFLDVGPLAEGHLLVVPREHHPRLIDLPGDSMGRITAALPLLGQVVMEVTGATGFNLLLNEGPVAGQVVPHMHFHMIPRRPGDQLGYRWASGKYAAGRDRELTAALQAAVARVRR